MSFIEDHREELEGPYRDMINEHIFEIHELVKDEVCSMKGAQVLCAQITNHVVEIMQLRMECAAKNGV